MKKKQNDKVCSYCGGNDVDAPCAYPSEGKPGCLRDRRLKTILYWTTKTIEKRRRVEEACKTLIYRGRHFSAKRDAVAIQKATDYILNLFEK